MLKKIKVAILYGGRSGEHEVSIVSASSVIKDLNREKYTIIPIGIAKDGRWYQNELSEVDPLNNKQLQVHGRLAKPFSLDLFFSEHCDIEVVFPVMHGSYCEDGCLQGCLELTKIPYVGAGVLASAICMDKDVTKRLALQRGIRITPYYRFTDLDWQEKEDKILMDIMEHLSYPLFVKPANTGSSVGINKVKSAKQLIPAIKVALKFDTKILVEQGLPVREVELAVLENLKAGEPPLVSVPGEIITTHEFYSYEAKYIDEKSLQLIIPAKNLSADQLKKLKEMAQEAFLMTECEGMARVDFFVHKETGEIFFNELNTIPGFTHVSMYPLLWRESGIAYPDLLDQLIQLGFLRAERKRKLVFDWAKS